MIVNVLIITAFYSVYRYKETNTKTSLKCYHLHDYEVINKPN